ncbi:TIGR03086 family protein [Streptomyces sp. TRM43335]|uniref:TIGR03086 family protein n=1 Tax=Streptomyces taklimakanensis TaxID=2569853 RepID=A0A6G2BCI0_9ACTN|nr:TIGR03086 family metal-binding protein [Streptomyces taklimakanensis]MTE19612.1 TIGR03086 family protein [Streptomyces taklimakanensis]
MDRLDALDRAYEEFDRRVRAVRDDQWDAPTPCAEWSVRDLVGHLVGEHLWAPWLLRGATLEEVGDRFDGDVLGDDPVAAWRRAAAESKAAFHRPGALEGRVHTSDGPRPTVDYAREMITDLTVHAWDLARGIGADDRLDEELARWVHDAVRPVAGTLRATGLFGEPVEVAPSAGPQERLVALLGRRP